MFAYLGFQLEMALYGAFLPFRSWRFLLGFLVVLIACSSALWELSCVNFGEFGILVNVAGPQGPLLCPLKTRSTLHSHAAVFIETMTAKFSKEAGRLPLPGSEGAWLCRVTHSPPLVPQVEERSRLNRQSSPAMPHKVANRISDPNLPPRSESFSISSVQPARTPPLLRPVDPQVMVLPPAGVRTAPRTLGVLDR